MIDSIDDRHRRRRSSSPDIRAPVAAKGHRQQFFSDPAIDKIYTILVAVMSEVSVLRERIDTHERLAAGGEVATPDIVDAYLPEPEVEAERTLAREDYIRRMFRVLHEEAARFSERSESDWNETIRTVRGDD